MNKKIKLGIGISIIVVVAVGLIKLPVYIQKVAVKTLEERTGRRVFSEEVRYNYLTSTLYLKDFKIMEANGKDPFISFDSFNVDIHFTKLLFKTLFIQEISLINPSLRIELSPEGSNYTDILESWVGSQEETPSKEVSPEVDSFLKKIELKNITIESFTLYYQDEVITADNNFTFKTPKLTYADNLFQLSSKLDFLDGSYLDISFNYNDSTNEFKGRFKGEDIELDDKLFLPKKFLDLSKLSGQVSLDMELQGETSANNYLISGETELANLEALTSEGKTLISLEKGRVSFPQLDILSSHFDIKDFSLEGLFFNLKEVLNHQFFSISSTEEKDVDSTFPKLDIEELSIVDSSIETPLATLENINLSLKDLGTSKGRSRVDLSLSLNKRTPVKIKGVLSKSKDLKTPEDLEYIGFKGRALVNTLNLTDINTFSQEVPYELSGLLNIDSQFNYSKNNIESENTVFIEEFNAKGKTTEENHSIKSAVGIFKLSLKDMIDYRIKGEVILNSLKISLLEKRPLFKAKEVRVLMEDVSKGKIIIPSMSLTKPRITIWEKEATKDSSTESTEKKIAEKPSTKEEQMEDLNGDLPLLLLENLQVREGRIDLVEEDFKYTLKNIEMDMQNFTSEKDREFHLLMEGGLTGLGRFNAESTMSLLEDWSFTETGLNIDGNFNISNLDLVDFNPLLKKTLPNEFKSGRVFYKGEMKLDAGNFKGENVISVKNIYPGKSTGNNPALPLKLGINLLKDKDNNLLLDIPVYGDFNDPHFRIYRVVLQALKNLVIRAVASPITMVTKSLGLSEDKISRISFEYLSSELMEEEKKKLDEISKVLNLKEDVKVKLILFTDLEREMDLFNENLKEEKIFKTNTKEEVLKKEVAGIINERKKNLLQYFRSKFLDEKVSVEVSSVLRDKPQSQVEFIFNK